MRFSRLLAAVGLALSFLVLTPAPSFACSCAQMYTDGQVRTADLVARGALVSRTPSGSAQDSAGEVTYAVRVEGVYKGSAARDLTVHAPASPASCGLENVALGREYVVFAYEGTGADRGQLWTNLCSGTAPVSAQLLAEVEQVAGVAEPPSPGEDVPTGSGAGQAGDPATGTSSGPAEGPADPAAPPVWVWPAGLALLAAVAAGAAAVRRRGPRPS